MDNEKEDKINVSEKSLLLGNTATEVKPRPKWDIIITWIVIILLTMILLDRSLWTHSSTTSSSNHVGSSSPHIIMFLVDDQGYNDIGYQSTDLSELTPNIDELANSGIKLSWYYTAAVCTPSRASLMTGMYTIHLGMQHGLVSGTHLFGLPLDVNPMSQIMKAAGYNSAMLGKWHLGHYTEDHLPTSRGFDSFLGYYSGFQDHFTHISESLICPDPYCFYDLRDGLASWDTSSLPQNLAYGPHLWQSRAVSFLESYDDSQALFLYYAESLVHEPIQAPDFIFDDYASVLDPIPNEDRRTFGAMTVYLDLVVKNLTTALQNKGMWDNTIFIYSSDNGGDPAALGSGSNVPLRGRKLNLFEGGVRVPAFIYSKLLPSKAAGSTYAYMFHISDWLPTIVQGILGRPNILKELSDAQSTLDGVNHWARLLEGSEVTNHASVTPSLSLLQSLVIYSAVVSHFVPIEEYPSKAPRSEILLGMDYLNFEHSWVGYDTAAVISGYYKLITNEVNETWWPTPGPDPVTREPLFLLDDTPVVSYLFNLRDDPEERVDLSLVYPEKVKELTKLLATYRKSMIETIFCIEEDEVGNVYQSISNFIAPWTDTTQTCPSRVLGDGTEELDFNPGYLLGSS